MLVNVQLSAGIRFQADIFQPERFRISRASIGPQQHVRFESLPAFQRQDHAVGESFDRLHLFVVPDDHPLVAKMIGECIDNLVIQELE